MKRSLRLVVAGLLVGSAATVVPARPLAALTGAAPLPAVASLGPPRGIIDPGPDGSHVLVELWREVYKWRWDAVLSVKDVAAGQSWPVPGDNPSLSVDNSVSATSTKDADGITTLTFTTLATGVATSVVVPGSDAFGDVDRVIVSRYGRSAAMSFRSGADVVHRRVVIVDVTGTVEVLPELDIQLAAASPDGRYVAVWRPVCDGAEPSLCHGSGWVRDALRPGVTSPFTIVDTAATSPPVAIADTGAFVAHDDPAAAELSLARGMISDDFRRAVVTVGSRTVVRDLVAGTEQVVPTGTRITGNGQVAVHLEGGGPVDPSWNDLPRPASIVAAPVVPSERAPYLSSRQPLGLPWAGTMVNVTVADPTGTGFLSVVPCGAGEPTTSTVNYTAGFAAANVAETRSGTCAYSQWATDVVVDEVGERGPGPDVPLVTGRVLDTRDPSGPTLGARVRADQTVAVPLGDAVPASTGALAVNLTVTEPVADGFAVVWACDQPRPATSNVNFRVGQTVANEAIVSVGAGTALCVSSHVPAHLVLDTVSAYDGSVVVPAPPSRLLDTRDHGADGPAVPAGGTVDYALPVQPGQVAVVHVTAVNATGPGWISTDCSDGPALTSVVNPMDSWPTSNLTLVDAAQGVPCLRTHGAVDLVVDLQTVFAAGAIAVRHVRVFDSRERPAPLGLHHA